MFLLCLCILDLLHSIEKHRSNPVTSIYKTLSTSHIIPRNLCSIVIKSEETTESNTAMEHNAAPDWEENRNDIALPHMLLRHGMGSTVIEENREGKHMKFNLKIPRGTLLLYTSFSCSYATSCKTFCRTHSLIFDYC